MKGLVEALGGVLGPGCLLTDAAAALVYARDASHLALGRPVAVALPRDADQVSRTVQACAEFRVPIVCRGAGTGLSGGALPPGGALVLATALMTDQGRVDPRRRLVRVQPGVLNEVISRTAGPSGLHFAPDPSSQSASTIGGNIAENAGGPHCLRHGVTLPHLRWLEWCDAGGRIRATGRGLAAERGVDLTSLLCGSEGTLGVVTAAGLNLIPVAEATATLLAVFPHLDDAVRAVPALLTAGLLPTAVEIVDQAMLLAVEKAFAFGFPTDVQAVMIVEFAGLGPEVKDDAEAARSILEAASAREVRLAASEAERVELWRCRKKAFGAVGRLAPSYVTMDVVVPLGRLPVLVRDIQRIKREHGVEIATAFHAGDGNLHPGVHYDDRDPDQTRRAHAAADAIIKRALELDGSVTGEHGVGIEKLHVLPLMMDRTCADLHWGIKEVFDPTGLFNPGKLLPDRSARFAPSKPLPETVEIRWESLTVTAPAGVSLAEIQAAVMPRGLWVPVGAWRTRPAGGWGLGSAGTVGDLVNDLVSGPTLGAAGTARDFLLEIWAETGGGRRFHTGAPVFKNVAGFGLAQALCGSGGILARPLAATFPLRPRPAGLAVLACGAPGGIPTGDLEPLLRKLRDRRGGASGAVAVIDGGREGLVQEVVLMVPGRSRPWDLDSLLRDLTGLADRAGLAVSTRVIEDFIPGTEDAMALGPVGLWAVGSASWTLMAPRRAAPGAQAPLLPTGANRVVWQADSGLCWCPDPLDSDGDWFADGVCRRGMTAPLPQPDGQVPLGILRGLKSLFDPEGKLACPPWLGGGGDG